MNNFGKIKTKILNKLVESYTSQNKTEIKNILKIIKEDKDFKELYLFYEEIEKTSLEYPDSAELYLETVEPLLIDKKQKAKNTIKKVSTLLENVESSDNDLYDLLDIISEKTELKNLDKKVNAKKKLIEHLSKPKVVEENYDGAVIQNEALLHTVLTNNFNLLYNETLSEEEKSELKSILSISNDELNAKTIELKETVLNEIGNLLNESNDNDFIEKLNSVKNEIDSMSINKYNYFRLKQLKSGLI